MEVKELTEKIQSAVEALHSAADTYHDEAKKFGEATGETKETIEKLNTDIDGLKERLDATETKIQRAEVPPAGDGAKGPETEEQKARKAAFYKFLRVGRKNMEPAEIKALVSDTTGLYLMPEDLEAEIYRGLPAIAVMRSLATIRPTAVDKVARRSITEVSVGWGKLETGTAITESTPVPSKDYLYVEDLYGLAKVGEDELADASDVQLANIIADSFRRAIAEAEDNGFTTGSGHSSSEPEGVAVDATIIASYKDNLATADAIIPSDVIGMEYELPAQYLQGAAFLMHRKTEKELRLVRAEVASGYYGNYLWQPSLQAGMPNNFDGYPIYNQASMNYPADATAAVNVIFGNFKAGYTILDRQGMTLQRLDELYAEAGLIGFKVHFRVGGGVVRPAAFRALYNNT
jgi:HK97 family phage major capsid protein